MLDHLSDRCNAIQPLATIGVKDQYLKLKNQGKDIINLGLGELNLKPPISFREKLKQCVNEDRCKYTSPNGILELRQYIIDFFDIDRSAEDVIITAGAKEAIFSTAMSFLNKGDEVALLEPAWPGFFGILNLTGAKKVSINCKLENDFIPLEEDLKNALSKNTKMLIMNSPCNPTGTIFPESTFKLISDLSEDHNFMVLSDEIYSKISSDKTHSMANFSDNAFVASAFSKSFSITGLRCGFLIAPNKEVAKHVNKVHTYVVGNAPSIIQYASLDFMDCSGYLKKLNNEINERRDIMLNHIKNIDNLKVNCPKGSFFIFPKFEGQLNSIDFCKKLLNDAHISSVPGIAFGDAFDSYFRISLSENKSRIEEAGVRLKSFLSDFNE